MGISYWQCSFSFFNIPFRIESLVEGEALGAAFAKDIDFWGSGLWVSERWIAAGWPAPVLF